MSDFVFLLPDAPVTAPAATEDETQPIEHVAAALNRVVVHLRNKPSRNYEKLLEAVITPIQDLEDATWALLDRTLDTMTGADLDRVGRLVGRARVTASDDDEYRAQLKARIAANRSHGKLSDLYRVARLLVGDVADLLIEYESACVYSLKISDVAIDPDGYLPAILASEIRRATASGYRMLVEYSTAEDDDAFTLAIAAFASSSLTAGATSIAVTSTAGFPATGTLTLDEGLASEETVTYSGKTGVSFTGVSALANNHTDTPIACVLSGAGVAPGLGDSTNAATGGKLAGVLE